MRYGCSEGPHTALPRSAEILDLNEVGPALQFVPTTICTIPTLLPYLYLFLPLLPSVICATTFKTVATTLCAATSSRCPLACRTACGLTACSVSATHTRQVASLRPASG